MRATISARHGRTPKELRGRAAELLDRLGQFTPFAQEGTVVFDAEALRQTVEIRIRLSGGQVLVASGEGTDHRTALDQAEGRMRRQLERPTARAGRGRRASRTP
jgi:ribosomal subunit interface protein